METHNFRHKKLYFFNLKNYEIYLFSKSNKIEKVVKQKKKIIKNKKN
jgi:hypothetical protein